MSAGPSWSKTWRARGARRAGPRRRIGGDRILRMRWLCLLLVLAPSLAAGQSFPVDDGGHPAPWCAWLDDTVTPAVSKICSPTNPIPFGLNPPLGSGIAYFGGQTGDSRAVTSAVPSISFFTPAGLIGLRSITGTGLVTYASVDGGATWSTGIALTGITVNWSVQPNAILRTTSTTPRFVVAAGNASGSVVSGQDFSGPWTISTGLNVNTTYGLAAQGSTVLAVGSQGGNIQACRSTDDGQTFGACVTIEAGADIGIRKPSPFVASPGPNIFLVSRANGKVWRSTDNGATWVTVLNNPALGEGPITCLTSTRCVVIQVNQVSVSSDAGATWVARTLFAAGTAMTTVCPYGAQTLTAIMNAGWPTVNGGTTQPAVKSIDGGVTWSPVPVTAGPAATTSQVTNGPCTVSGANASFITQDGAGPPFTAFTWFGGPKASPLIIAQSATRLDACNLGVTATGASGAAVTATLPAVLGSFHYLCLIEIRAYASTGNAGAGTPRVVTSTNLPGGNAWTFQTALALGISEGQSYTPTTPIKSASAGVATTIVAPATGGGGVNEFMWRINVYYYAAP